MSLRILVNYLATASSTLLTGLHLEIPSGEVHTLMGASGSGKSSLLAAVCGTLPPGMQWDGEVYLNGKRIDTLRIQDRHIGLLFQEDLLFAHMTVRENLLFALPQGRRDQRETCVLQALADVEMGHSLHADPATLSGGQRARVALARALIAQPHALLLDEPFSKLDSALRSRMRELVFGLVRQRHIPALLVTHDPADIANPAQLTMFGESV